MFLIFIHSATQLWCHIGERLKRNHTQLRVCCLKPLGNEQKKLSVFRWPAGDKGRTMHLFTYLNKVSEYPNWRCSGSCQLNPLGFMGVSGWQGNHGVLSLSPWQGACRGLMVCPHCQLQTPSRPHQGLPRRCAGFFVYSSWDSLMNGYLSERIHSLPL